MNYENVCQSFGNGNATQGYKLIQDIASRLNKAREKHPRFADDAVEAIDVIGDEWREYSQAVMQSEGDKRERNEALDVIATAIRAANREYDDDSTL